jgi:putative photosynthetic complex assembly protein
MMPAAENPKLPRGFIIAACGMAVLTLVMTSIARLTGYQPDRPPPSTVVEVRDLKFEDRPDGAVLVYDAADGHLAYTVQPGTDGFVRGVLRGLVRDRRANHIGAGPPFRFTRWADGRLSLDDPSTGHHVDLEVFGPTNAGAFAEIFLAGDRREPRQGQ